MGEGTGLSASDVALLSGKDGMAGTGVNTKMSMTPTPSMPNNMMK